MVLMPRPFPLFILLTVAHSLGTNFFLSPALRYCKYPMWPLKIFTEKNLRTRSPKSRLLCRLMEWRSVET